MRYGLSQVVAPTVEPLRLAEVKAHLYIDHSDHDDQVLRLIAEAREEAELATDRQLCTATWELSLDRLPAGREPLLLPKGKLQDVESVIYGLVDEAEWDPENYVVSATREPGRVVPASGISWPSVTDVAIQFTCGYGGQADVPALLKRAMLLLIGASYMGRENTAALAGVTRAQEIFTRFAIGDEFVQYAGEE